MPFAGLLKDLVNRVSGAKGAVMSAYDGEPVAEAIANTPISGTPIDPYDIQLMGAQFRSTLSKIDQVNSRLGLASSQSIAIRFEEYTLLVQNLEDNYFLLLSLQNGLGLVGVDRQMEQMAERICREM